MNSVQLTVEKNNYLSVICTALVGGGDVVRIQCDKLTHLPKTEMTKLATILTKRASLSKDYCEHLCKCKALQFWLQLS